MSFCRLNDVTVMCCSYLVCIYIFFRLIYFDFNILLFFHIAWQCGLLGECDFMYLYVTHIPIIDSKLP